MEPVRDGGGDAQQDDRKNASTLLEDLTEWREDSEILEDTKAKAAHPPEEGCRQATD